MAAHPSPSQAAPALTIVLAAIYAVLLVVVILLKFPFNGPESARALNLIPYAGLFGGGSGFGQDIENILAFVPYGIYLSMLLPRWTFLRRFLIILATTVAFEAIQYTFAIGRADITDVLDNALGGVIGIGVYALLARLLPRRAHIVLKIVLVLATVAFLILCLRLFTHDRGIPLI